MFIAIGTIVVLGSGTAAHAGAVTAIPCAAKAKAVIANSGQSTHNSGSLVQGDVQAAQAIVLNGGVITGTRTANSPAGLAVVPVPAGATNLGNLVITGTRNFTAGNYVASSFTMNGGATITVSGGIVQIWVTGALVLTGSANNNGSPQNLEFLVNGTQDAHVNSNTRLFGFIYAPNAAVLVDSVVHGSVVGSKTTINSGGQVLFDAGSTCTVCTPPQTLCNGTCVNTQTDPANCGACGNVCPGGNTCQSGMCTPTVTCGSNPHCIQAITAGSIHTCALMSDTTVACWGDNIFGELGNGTIDPIPGPSHPTPATVPGLTGVTALAAGDVHTCALVAGGAVTCWGDGIPTPTPVAGLTGASAISTGGISSPPFPNDPDCFVGDNSHNCVLFPNGTMSCWGGNHCGQLGDGTTVSRPTPLVVPGLSGVVAIAAGGNQSCAILADGTGRCWGRNVVGALGDGTQTDRLTPVAVVGLSNASSISEDIDHACAVRRDGTVQCWGDNFFGQVGVNEGIDGSNQNNILMTARVVQSLTGAIGIGTGTTTSCALLSGGGVDCWGNDFFAQLGNGTTNSVPNPVPAPVVGLSGGARLASGQGHSCTVLGDGTAVCWGSNNSGQIGNPAAANPALIPVPVQF
jgi:alpha-tubulin suppressor-like RCC1 family protein